MAARIGIVFLIRVYDLSFPFHVKPLMLSFGRNYSFVAICCSSLIVYDFHNTTPFILSIVPSIYLYAYIHPTPEVSPRF